MGERGELVLAQPARRARSSGDAKRATACSRSIASPVSWRRVFTKRRPRRRAPLAHGAVVALRARLERALLISGRTRSLGSHRHLHPERLTSIGRTSTPWRCGVLDQRRRVVEAHRPGVEQRDVEGGGVVGLELGAGVGDQREARGVRLGEAVEGERGDRLDDLRPAPRPGCRARSCRRAAARSIAVHALDRALEAHGAPQLLGLAAGEAGGHHRHRAGAAPGRSARRACA